MANANAAELPARPFKADAAWEAWLARHDASSAARIQHD
jgi:hypothetical protein